MSKRNRNQGASSAPQASNELDALLEGVETTVPEGLLAGSTLESLEDENHDDGDLLSLHDEDGTEVITVGGPNVETGVDKQAIYNDQESKLTPADEQDAAPVEQPKRGRKKAASGSPSGPSPTRITVNGGPRSATLTSKTNVAELVKIGFEEDDIPAIVSKIDALPKKVTEKAYNLIRYACGREQLSNYTRFTIETLRDDGPMSVPELVKRMEARGWSAGTSRSQSQQMSRMFAVYDMTEKSDGKIGLKTDNPFVKNIIDRLAAKAA